MGGTILVGRNTRAGRAEGYDGNSEWAIRQKLMPYLDGRTPLCDILWMEDLTHDAVLTAVRNNPSIIINVRPLRTMSFEQR